MTVSRVLRNTGHVSKEVTESVLQAANEIGYVRNNLAGSFAGQSSNLIGVIVPSLSNSVFTEVLSGFEDAIRGSPLQMAIGVSHYDRGRELELVTDMLAWRPAAIVLTGMEHDERTRSLLGQDDVRTVEMMDIDGLPISTCVGLSHRAAAETTARHLVERGHTRFGYVGCALQMDERAVKRKAAFEGILEASGLTFERTALSPDRSSMMLGRRLTAGILQGNDRPILLYYSNDDLASGGLLHCLSREIPIPGHVAIASFNGLEFLDAMPMRITTFKSPRYRIGQIAGRHVLGEMTEATTRLSGELVIGDTT